MHLTLMCFQAQLRAGKKMAAIPKRRASTVLTEAMAFDTSDCTNTVSIYIAYSVWCVVKQGALTSLFVLII